MEVKIITGNKVPSQKGSHIPVLSIANYPNPFTDITTISFTAPENQKAELVISDIRGREITGVDVTGTNRYTWKAEQVTNGVYIGTITEGGFSQS